MIATPKLIATAAAVLALTAGLHAQDITVSDPVWMSKTPAPEQLPTPKSKLRPYYPSEMKKTSELGYVIITRYVDASGKTRILSAVGTHVPFQRAVEAEFPGWQFSAGKDHGQPVDGQVWEAAIFNPKSASTSAADATPRLLQVAPAFTKHRVAPPSNLPVVSMKLSLDATGAIIDAEPQSKIKSAIRHAIDEALKSWKFAPARKGNQAVAAELVVPVLCLSEDGERPKVGVPPSAVKRTPPKYPFAMRRFGIGGQVMVDFVVDKEGDVQNPVVIQSDNPEFDAPALQSVRTWKFTPGTQDGEPVATHMRVPIVFTLDGGDRNAFQIEERGSSKLPPELQYDTPAKIRGVQIPVYPYSLRRDGVTGKATVSMVIGPNGHVAAVKVLSADRPEFGLALVAAAEGYVFDPALKDGKPVPFLLKLQQEFNRFDLPDDSGDDLLQLEKKHPEKVVSAAKLDAALKPISRRTPTFPVTAAQNADVGEADIEIDIDEEGHARLPRIVSATDTAFGYAAVQAANAWWFDPPKQNGKTVATRVVIPFRFGGKKSGS